MAYAATHFDASARPSRTPTAGIATQNQRRVSRRPSHSQANSEVRGEDEEADVDVVHRDPALDEEHPVEQHEQPHQDADDPAPEQDPREQEQDAGRERAEDHARQAPGERVVARRRRRRPRPSALNARSVPRPSAGIVRRCGRAPRRPGRTAARGRRTPPCRAARSTYTVGDAVRRGAEDLDHQRGVVEHDRRAGRRAAGTVDVWSGPPAAASPVTRDDRHLGIAGRRVGRGDVELAPVVDVGDEREAVGAVLHRDLGRDRAARREEAHARRRPRPPSWARPRAAIPGSLPVVDRLSGGCCACRPRAWRRARPGPWRSRPAAPRQSSTTPPSCDWQLLRGGGRVGHLRRRRDEGREVADRLQARDAGERGGARRLARVEVDDVDRVAGHDAPRGRRRGTRPAG